MIRINLLPFRAARRKENVRRQISIYSLSVLFLVLVAGYLWMNMESEISSLESKKAKLEKELATYSEIRKKIKKLRNRVNELKEKLEIIRTLEANKTGPVRLLDEIAVAVPEGRLWLDNLSEQQGRLTLKGTAEDNDTVALFMENLKEAEHIVSVDLESTKLRSLKVEEEDLNLMDFTIKSKTYLFKEKEKKKGRR